MQKKLIYLLLNFLLTGCASISDGVSIDEANRLAIEFSQQAYTPPERSINDVRLAYKDYDLDKEINCTVVLQNSIDKQKANFKKLASPSTKNSVKSAPDIARAPTSRFYIASDIAYNAQEEFMRGNYQSAIEISEHNYNILRSGGANQIIQAVLAGTIGRMYTEIGESFRAKSWFGRAARDWNYISSGTKKWINTSYARTNIISNKVSKAYLANNIPAEEYYLRQALLLVWNNQYNRLASVAAEHATARLITNLLLQGRPTEAEVIAHTYLLGNIDPNYKRSMTKPLLTNGLAESLYAQNRLEEAEYAARLSLTIHANICSSQDGIPHTKARRTLIRILAARGDWQNVQSLKTEIKLALSKNPDRYQQLYGANPNFLLADIFSSGNNQASWVDQVMKAKDQTLDEHGSDSIEWLELEAVSGMIWQRLGNHDRALQAYSNSIETLLNQSTTTIGRSGRYQMFRNAYIEFLVSDKGRKAAKSQGINPTTASFRLANLRNVGNVQRALSVAALKANLKDKELAKLIRQIQNLGHQAGNMLDLIVFLQSGQEGQVDTKKITELNAQHSTLRIAKKQLEQQVSDRYPAYSQLLNPTAPDIETLKQNIRPGELLIVYYVARNHTYFWNLRRDGQLTFHQAALGEEELNKTVATLRQSLDPKAEILGEIPDFDVPLANHFYQQLLAPVLDQKQGVIKDLVIVPSGDIGILPLGLLVTEDKQNPLQEGAMFSEYRDIPWLINQYSVSIVPSATSLILLRQIESDATTGEVTFIGYGDPQFKLDQPAVDSEFSQRSVLALRSVPPRQLPLYRRAVPDTRQVTTATLASLPRLPDTADEVQEIGKVLHANPDTDVLLGIRATEASVKQGALEGKDVVVFATHGLLPGDLNGLDQPALAMTNPEITYSEEDGLLTMEEILGLKLDSDWVILSACNTGAGNGQGAEAFSGLGQAFFYAGTKSLLLTNWPVESVSAKLLTTGIFHARNKQPELTRAQALRESMQSLMSKTGMKGLFSYAHPIFWAPFSLVGDGG